MQIHSPHKRKTWTIQIPFLAIVAIAITLLGLMNLHRILMEWELKSDGCYILSIYKDIFINGFGLSGWYLTPSPYFFPDMALFFFTRSLTGEDGFALGLYTLLYYTLILVFIYKIFSYIAPKRDVLNYSAFSLVLFISLLHFPLDEMKIRFFLLPSYHGGMLLCGLGSFYLVLKGLEEGPRWGIYLVLILLILISTLSDPLFFVQTSIPIAICLILFGLLSSIPLRRWLPIFCVVTAVGMLSFLSSFYTEEIFESVTVLKPSLTPSVANIIQKLPQLFSHLFSILYLEYPFLLFTIFLLSYLVYVLRNKFILGNQTEYDKESCFTFILFFLLFSILSSIISVLITGNWYSNNERRYFLPLYLYSVIAVVAIFAREKVKIPKYIRTLFLVTFLSFCIFRVTILTVWPSLEHFNLKYPLGVQELDTWAIEHNLLYGYGDYLNAKYTNTYTREGIQINPIRGDLAYFPWINNTTWFYRDKRNKNQFPLYQFIATNRIDTSYIQKQFGPPAEVKQCQAIEVYLYNREQDFAFRNYLRRYFPSSYHAPISPPELHQATPEQVPWGSAGSRILQATETVTAFYNPPARGNLIEVNADNNDYYQLVVYTSLKNRESVKLTVKPTGEFGLTSRYMPLPPTLSNAPINKIEISPQKGDNYYGVGHIFVYDDAFLARKKRISEQH